MGTLAAWFAGYLQLSNRQPPEMCALQTRPWMDVDQTQFLDRTAIGGWHIVSPPPPPGFVIFWFHVFDSQYGIQEWHQAEKIVFIWSSSYQSRFKQD